MFDVDVGARRASRVAVVGRRVDLSSVCPRPGNGGKERGTSPKSEASLHSALLSKISQLGNAMLAIYRNEASAHKRAARRDGIFPCGLDVCCRG